MSEPETTGSTLRHKILEARAPGILAFTSALFVILTLSGGIKLPPSPDPRLAYAPGIWANPYFLAGCATLLAAVAIVLIVRSRARFFIAASSIMGGEFGFVLFDVLRVTGVLSTSSWFSLEVVRTPDWRVQAALIVLAGLLYVLDHLRRPP